MHPNLEGLDYCRSRMPCTSIIYILSTKASDFGHQSVTIGSTLEIPEYMSVVRNCKGPSRVEVACKDCGVDIP